MGETYLPYCVICDKKYRSIIEGFGKMYLDHKSPFCYYPCLDLANNTIVEENYYDKKIKKDKNFIPNVIL